VSHFYQPNPKPALDPPGPSAERNEKPIGITLFYILQIVDISYAEMVEV